MILENESKYSFTETVNRITEQVEKIGWRMPATHDLQQTIRKFGKEILPVTVLEICHPKHSSQLLELDAERIVSCFMPCRISVYEHSDGKTYVSRMNSGLMFKQMGSKIEEVMTAVTVDVELMLEQIIKV